MNRWIRWWWWCFYICDEDATNTALQMNEWKHLNKMDKRQHVVSSQRNSWCNSAPLWLIQATAAACINKYIGNTNENIFFRPVRTVSITTDCHVAFGLMNFPGWPLTSSIICLHDNGEKTNKSCWRVSQRCKSFRLVTLQRRLQDRESAVHLKHWSHDHMMFLYSTSETSVI